MRELRISIFLVIMWSQSVFANGAVISFGGDEDIQRIHRLAQELAHKLAQVPDFILPEGNLSLRFQEEMKTLNIVVTSKPLFWEGTEVFAINYPQEIPKKLVISRSKLNSIKEPLPLVLHELLPLVGVGDRDYKASQEIMKVLRSWHSGKSSEYFMQRYWENNNFLERWAQNAEKYYSDWGGDGSQLLTYFAFYDFPIRNDEVSLWSTIINQYVKTYSAKICEDNIFKVKLDSLKRKTQKPYPEISFYFENWYQSLCKDLNI